jgi:hypothetical protein
MLWSKYLPDGEYFELKDNISGIYLYHKSGLGEFFLGSDSITHSYRNHKRKAWLIQQIQKDVKELFFLNDLVDQNEKIKFYLPFDQLQNKTSICGNRRLYYLQKGSNEFHKGTK